VYTLYSQLTELCFYASLLALRFAYILINNYTFIKTAQREAGRGVYKTLHGGYIATSNRWLYNGS
jgi:hypothetical protein